MRYKLLYLVHIIHVSLGAPSNESSGLESKIVGGTPVELHRFPSAVQFFNHGNLCAGSILNSWTVLTAAHCFDLHTEIDEMIIQVGARFLYDHRASVYDVVSYVMHPRYNNETQFACDIALLFAESPIEFSKHTKKAILVNHNRWMNQKEKDFEVTGWGMTSYGGPVSERGLLMAHLEFVSSKRCARLHALVITSDMFCLYGGGAKDTCKGDSGGGVFWNSMLVGVTSHGDGCARKDKPSVYTNVWYFRRWIEATIKKYMDDYCNKKRQNKITNKNKRGTNKKIKQM